MNVPVAATAEAALHAPLGLAAREREAVALAHGPVAFVTDWVGPAFATREAAAEAYGERGLGNGCALRPVSSETARAEPPAQPVNRDGVRWPPTRSASKTHWRLSVTYWRTTHSTATDAAELEPARRLRRDAASSDGLDPRTLRRLTDQPLRPVRPQQPLDIGLFETRLPERPDIVVPDD